ncbi:MAG: four-carbon acid sugar kinase family protein [Treponema sp.]|nr:four-carbon acid sugar kinase family protein [Treponema sp.]
MTIAPVTRSAVNPDKHNERLLVLADDLTGALDTGVQFAKKSISTGVFPCAEEINAVNQNTGSPDFSVTVINTDSRHISPEASRKIIKTAVNADNNFTYFYKKTDSCLRGNIGAELEALMEAADSRFLAFVPAYPDLKRYTRNGYQYLEEKPIHESSMANDPFNPITESFVPAIIGKQSKIPVRIVPAGGKITASKNREILVFDAQETKDLKSIAAALLKKKLLHVSAGCAGFAQALTETLPLEKKPDTEKQKITELPLLIVSGSLHPVSINQVKTAMRADIPAIGANCDAVSYGAVYCGAVYRETSGMSDPAPEDAEKIISFCAKELGSKKICILGTKAALGEKTMSAEDTAPGKGQADVSASAQIAQSIGSLVKKIISKTGPLNLAIFGGDTLLGIAKALEYKCLAPLLEIRPGVVLAQIYGQEKGLLITKAGAFGEANLIKIIADYLNSRYLFASA